MIKNAINTLSDSSIFPDSIHGPTLLNLPSNIHICHFYKKKEDLIELLFPFFKEGLKKNEFCLWGVTSPLNVELATNALNKELNGTLSNFIKSGQIEIFDITELYGKESFDAMAVKDGFLKKVFSALGKGWNGFRCDGMTSGINLKNWKNFQTYEIEISRSLPEASTAICSYDLNTLTPENIIEVVSAHQACLVKKYGGWTVQQSVEHIALNESRRKEQEFRELADTIPQLAWIADNQGNIYWHNKRWHDYTGISVNQSINGGWEDAHDPTELPVLFKIWKQSNERICPFEVTLRLRNSKNTFSPFLIKMMPLQDQNGMIRKWIGIGTNHLDLPFHFKKP